MYPRTKQVKSQLQRKGDRECNLKACHTPGASENEGSARSIRKCGLCPGRLNAQSQKERAEQLEETRRAAGGRPVNMTATLDPLSGCTCRSHHQCQP